MEAREDGNFAQSCDRMLIHGAHPILYAYCNNGRYPQETVIDLGTSPFSSRISYNVLSPHSQDLPADIHHFYIGDFIDNDKGRLHCFGSYAE